MKKILFERLIVKTIPRKDKTNEEGNCPIYLRVNINRSETTFSTGYFVDAERWKLSKGFKVTNKPMEQDIRRDIDNTKESLEHISNTLQSENRMYNAKLIVQIHFGKVDTKKNTTLMEMFEIHKEHFLETAFTKYKRRGASPEEAKKDSIVVYRNFSSSQKYVLQFLKEKRKDNDIQLNHLDDLFQQDFFDWLMKTDLANNTVIKYFVTFNQIVKFSCKKKYLDKYPFTDSFELEPDKSKTPSLTLDEISTIYNKKFKPVEVEGKLLGSDRLSFVRDVFIFGIMTGYSYQEIFRISNSNIVTEEGRRVIKIKRKKSGNDENVPLTKESEAIIKKYANDEYCLSTGKIFPSRSNFEMNRCLKGIAIQCGIEKNISTKVSRKTYATVLYNAGTPLQHISKLVGHSQQSTTERFYVDTYQKSLNEEVDKGFKGVFNKLRKVA